MPDARVFNQGFREQVLRDIMGDENKLRKRDAWKRYEVYRDRQDQFVEAKLKSEFGEKTLSEIRKITSINLTKRICNKQASIYSATPKRTWTDASDEEIKLIEAHYKYSRANVKLKKSNKFYKLLDQCALYVGPRNSELCFKVLSTHQYDVVPNAEDPEYGSIYIINTFNKADFERTFDDKNQAIADPQDYKAKIRFIWWTDEVNFWTNGLGEIIPPGSKEDFPNIRADGMLDNPIGRLPFIDIAWEKDLEFWVRMGKNKVEFNIDFSTILCDWATVQKLQGYAQAVIVSEEIPNNLVIGPTRVVHIKATSTTTIQPSFQFVAPSPDLSATLEGLKVILSLFLTSEGLDAKTISGTAEGEKFTSGLERLLALIDQFEATRDDFDLFEWVEEQKFQLVRDWNNALQDDDFFRDELRGPQINDKAKESVEFARPEAVQTKMETEDSVIKRLDAGLITLDEAIMEIRGLSEEEAKLIVDKLKKFADERMKEAQKNMEAQEGVDDGEGQGDDEGEPAV